MELSIIITFYKGEKFILKLLSSIRDSYIMSSKILSIEVIIVVDYPQTNIYWLSNNVKTIFEPFSINFKILKNKKNIGTDKSRDIGLQNATGYLFTCIDQDDLLEKEYFRVIEKYIEKNVDFFILNGNINNLCSNKKVPVFYFMPKITLKRIIYNNLFISPSFMIVNRNFALAKNLHYSLPFNDEKGSDDWYFNIQLLSNNKNPNYIAIKNKILSYSIHEDNYSHRFVEMANGSIKLLQSLKVNDKKIIGWINSKISSFNFYKSMYYQNKIKISLLHPIKMIKYMLIYSMDLNRLIRYLHKKVINFNKL